MTKPTTTPTSGQYRVDQAQGHAGDSAGRSRILDDRPHLFYLRSKQFNPERV